VAPDHRRPRWLDKQLDCHKAEQDRREVYLIGASAMALLWKTQLELGCARDRLSAKITAAFGGEEAALLHGIKSAPRAVLAFALG
jgi:hypothetical protein